METLQATGPFRFGDVTLVPIERAELRSVSGDAGCWMSAVKEPVAVVVCDSGGIYALDMNSSEIALAALIEKTPNFGAILSELSGS